MINCKRIEENVFSRKKKMDRINTQKGSYKLVRKNYQLKDENGQGI